MATLSGNGNFKKRHANGTIELLWDLKGGHILYCLYQNVNKKISNYKKLQLKIIKI